MAKTQRISATEAARSFSDVVSRVRYRNEEFVVEKGGEAMCRITAVGRRAGRSTIGDLLKLFEELPPFDKEYRKAVTSLANNQDKLPRSPWERA